MGQKLIKLESWLELDLRHLRLLLWRLHHFDILLGSRNGLQARSSVQP